SHSNACWCAATTRPSWSISTSSRSRSRSTCHGSIQSIRGDKNGDTRSAREHVHCCVGGVDLKTAETEEPRQDLPPARHLLAAAVEPVERHGLAGAAGRPFQTLHANRLGRGIGR